MRAHDVEAVTSEMISTLGGRADLPWNAPAGPVEWSCRDTALHVADDLFTYASQLATETAYDHVPYEISVAPDTGPNDVLRVVETGSALLASVLRTAHPGARGWHPNGVSDPGGFAAMGVVEIVVHTHDIATGLGLDWTPPEDTCRAVLDRLFPDAPADAADPVATLLWATGRGELDGVPVRDASWRWDSSVRA